MLYILTAHTSARLEYTMAFVFEEVFGIDYKNHKKDKRKIALFSTADLIMESLDGFVDLIELKRPSAEIMKFDDSHTSYYPSTDLSKVL